MADKQFPVDLLTQMLTIKEHYMVNKELTEIYLKIKYQMVCIPDQIYKAFNERQMIFPYPKYVKTLFLNFLVRPDGNFMDCAIFENATKVVPIGLKTEVGVTKFAIVVKSLRSLTEIVYNDYPKSLPGKYIMQGITDCKTLTTLKINGIDEHLEIINTMPTLTILKIESITSDQSCKALVHIETLTLAAYTTGLNDKLFLYFPNVTHLTISVYPNYKRQSDNLEIFNFDGFSKLTHLSCEGKFEIPKNVVYLTCENYKSYILIPPSYRIFKEVTFLLKYECVRQKRIQESEYQICKDYLKQADFKAKIVIPNNKIYSNYVDIFSRHKYMHSESNLYLYCCTRTK